MFTQPQAEYKTTQFDEQGNVTETWIPVPRNLWDYFATQKQAEKLLTANVKPVVADAELMDGLNLDLFIPVRYTGDGTDKIWVIKGTRVIGGLTWSIDEYAGSLCDRRIKPNPFVDGHGGPSLIPVPITVDGVSTGIAQLKWGA